MENNNVYGNNMGNCCTTKESDLSQPFMDDNPYKTNLDATAKNASQKLTEIELMVMKSNLYTQTRYSSDLDIIV